ncbi:methyltransferase domain-containing protein [Candidatus Woesearchaeota archaeon]|nr:methyltransferase domain-containing protein [Candidatus Woesearchaeota archaeon]
MENKFDKNVKKVYAHWSKSYDNEDNPALFAEKNFAIDMLSLNEKDIVLDYGCGTGRNIDRILKFTKKVHGIDISENMLSIARKKFSNVDLKSPKNKNKIPFDNTFFTKILCSFVISHIKNIDILFKEFNRVLVDEGKLVISTIHPEANFSKYRLKPGDRFELMSYDINIQHTFAELKKSLINLGFEVEEKMTIKITNDMEHYYPKESFAQIVNMPFLLILGAKKCSDKINI